LCESHAEHRVARAKTKQPRPLSVSARARHLACATELVRRVCEISGDLEIVGSAHDQLFEHGIQQAVQSRDNDVLFGWLNASFAFAGIADRVAHGYMEQHGRLAAADISRTLPHQSCGKLQSYWHFDDCKYRKQARSCAEPKLFRRCALPKHDLRHGGLNQTAYSLFFFFRDVTEGDFVGWLDEVLERADVVQGPGRGKALAAAIVEPLSHVHGVAAKVLNMALSGLLLAGDPGRERWQAAGASMIAVDTLVHAWLHRTGILRRFHAEHVYGPACYGGNGCEALLRTIAFEIDARDFNPRFPRHFPRFVQHAIWRYCAADEFDVCNGNRVDDTAPCRNRDCELYRRCRRLPLHAER
jgi:hypothetical protein